MATKYATHAVGNSIITFLRNTYPTDLETDFPCTFDLFASGQFNNIDADATQLSLFLHRITVNEHLRNVNEFRAPHIAPSALPLSLDLHFLLTVWANSAEAEHTIMTWAIQQLYLNPILNLTTLIGDVNWQQDDFIQVIPAELSNEDIMRIWDAIEPGYRLSFSYIARAVRIDPDETPDHLPVVATRFGFGQLKDIEPDGG